MSKFLGTTILTAGPPYTKYIFLNTPFLKMINENSVKSVILDSTRSSSNNSGMRQFNFPATKLPKEGYYKVTAVFVKGTLPTSAYLQVTSPELGDLNQTTVDN